MERVRIPVPLGIREVNVYFARDGEQVDLLDAGIGTDASRATVAQTLGFDRPRNVYISHGHVDHVGGARALADRGACIHAHPGDSPLIERFQTESQARNESYAHALGQHGLPLDICQRMAADRSIEALTQDVVIEKAIQGGDSVVFGKETLRIHHLPGHTPGSLIYEGERLYTGDTLLRKITSNSIEIRDCDHGQYQKYLQTLDAMERFVGMEVCPGHFEPFLLDQDILDRHRDRHERRRAKILRLLERGPATAYQLLGDLFEGLSPSAYFLAMSDTIGHLHNLELEGELQWSLRDGRRWFARCA